jgi:hypothetical protein
VSGVTAPDTSTKLLEVGVTKEPQVPILLPAKTTTAADAAETAKIQQSLKENPMISSQPTTDTPQMMAKQNIAINQGRVASVDFSKP